MTDLTDRYRGCLLGLACGDAVGTSVEFSPRGTFPPLTDMRGGGPFDLRPGEWTDDTSMGLCLGESLVHLNGFDATDQMNRYCNWRSMGYMSSNGRCFDIGITVSTALDRYLTSGDPYAGDTDPDTAGNGGLMRLAPIPMFYAHSISDTFKYAGESTRTTHATREAIECSRLFALQLRLALTGASKEAVILPAYPEPLSPAVAAIANGNYRSKTRNQVRGTGYCVASLEAALWCFWHGESFEDSILLAANLGDDADTTAAICGQIAGAFYGSSRIPATWLDKLVMREEIEQLSLRLLACARIESPQ